MSEIYIKWNDCFHLKVWWSGIAVIDDRNLWNYESGLASSDLKLLWLY
jgi:hypothetical protein